MFKNVSKKMKAVAVATAASLATTAVPAFAAAGDIDGSAVALIIGGGLAAVALIGAAWKGIVYLKKTWNIL